MIRTHQNSNSPFFRLLLIAASIAAVVVFAMAFSSCKFFRSLESSKASSENVAKEKEDNNTVDSSSRKSGKEYEREIFIPVSERDTNNFVFNLPKQDPQYIYIRERGSEQVEQNDLHKEDKDKEKETTDKKADESKETETSAKLITTDMLLIALLVVIGLPKIIDLLKKFKVL